MATSFVAPFPHRPVLSPTVHVLERQREPSVSQSRFAATNPGADSVKIRITHCPTESVACLRTSPQELWCRAHRREWRYLIPVLSYQVWSSRRQCCARNLSVQPVRQFYPTEGCRLCYHSVPSPPR